MKKSREKAEKALNRFDPKVRDLHRERNEFLCKCILFHTVCIQKNFPRMAHSYSRLLLFAPCSTSVCAAFDSVRILFALWRTFLNYVHGVTYRSVFLSIFVERGSIACSCYVSLCISKLFAKEWIVASRRCVYVLTGGLRPGSGKNDTWSQIEGWRWRGVASHPGQLTQCFADLRSIGRALGESLPSESRLGPFSTSSRPLSLHFLTRK